MEKNEFSKERIDAILKKRKNCEQLTPEEEVFCQKAVDALLSSKNSLHRKFEVKTGDEIRKEVTLKKPASTKPKFEDGKPKNRGFKGGFDAKADVDERTTQAPNNAKAESPTRKETNPAKGKELPKEDSSGKVIATEDAEHSDADNKPYENPFYEEDRVGRLIERGKPAGSIKIHDVVKKEVGTAIIVGRVLKVYDKKDGQNALLVKWATGQISHVNERQVSLVKTDKSPKVKSEEDNQASPPVKKALPLGVLQSLKDKAKDKSVDEAEAEDEEEKVMQNNDIEKEPDEEEVGKIGDYIIDITNEINKMDDYEYEDFVKSLDDEEYAELEAIDKVWGEITPGDLEKGVASTALNLGRKAVKWGSKAWKSPAGKKITGKARHYGNVIGGRAKQFGQKASKWSAKELGDTGISRRLALGATALGTASGAGAGALTAGKGRRKRGAIAGALGGSALGVIGGGVAGLTQRKKKQLDKVCDYVLDVIDELSKMNDQEYNNFVKSLNDNEYEELVNVYEIYKSIESGDLEKGRSKEEPRTISPGERKALRFGSTAAGVGIGGKVGQTAGTAAGLASAIRGGKIGRAFAGPIVGGVGGALAGGLIGSRLFRRKKIKKGGPGSGRVALGVARAAFRGGKKLLGRFVQGAPLSSTSRYQRAQMLRSMPRGKVSGRVARNMADRNFRAGSRSGAIGGVAGTVAGLEGGRAINRTMNREQQRSKKFVKGGPGEEHRQANVNKINKQSLDDLVTPEMEDRIIHMAVEGMMEARPDMSEATAKGLVMDAWRQTLEGSREEPDSQE